jgi:hypothetical protein
LIAGTAGIGYAAIRSTLNLLIVTYTLGVAGVTGSNGVHRFEFVEAYILDMVNQSL